MQALGNDFIMIDAVSQSFHALNEAIVKLADRHRGVGCDQLLIARPAVSDTADVFCQIFNADGSEAEQCGNGLRCFARFVYDRRIVKKTQGLRIETCGGVFHADILSNGDVKIDMGAPVFEPSKIPFETEKKTLYVLTLDEKKEVEIGAVSMVNPHAVLKVTDINLMEVKEIGATIECHQLFPKNVNVGFMQIKNSAEIYLRVYERGVGETQACGSGACAAVAVGQLWKELGNEVQVIMKGGVLRVMRDPASSRLWMTGEANFVFNGSIDGSYV